jgi:serine/threonine protein kinase
MTLFRAALAEGGREQWERFVRSACDGDTELQAELLEDLDQHERMGDFLSAPLIPRIEDARPFVPGDLAADRFQTVREVGEGGMAVVYEAIDGKLGERRAIKCPRPGFRRQMPPEARHAMRVTHSNVCRVYEIHSTQKACGPMDILSMEFVEGETLASRLARSLPDCEEALDIARQICEGLGAAHRERLLHRDLKPNNVMLTRSSMGACEW